MNPARTRAFLAAVLAGTSFALLQAQNAPRISQVEQTTNGELILRLAGTNTLGYRIETSTNPPGWTPVTTLPGAASIQFTDQVNRLDPRRFYRAAAVPGDHYATSNGPAVVSPIDHASFVIRWNGYTILNDPVGSANLYTNHPKADLILVSHTHGDHFNAGTLDAVRATNALAMIITPRAATNSMSAALRSRTIALTNGATTHVLGIQIQAVPAYNANHAVGTGNGYVINLGGRRFYMSGDTGDIPETRALTNIDVAFVCMNTPFTMHYTNAASVVRAFRPGVVYPYHFRNMDGTYADLNDFERRVGTDLGIEVRKRRWYTAQPAGSF